MTTQNIIEAKPARKSVARDAYLAATQNPAATDWQAIAALLFAAVPADKSSSKPLSDWPDYDAKKAKLVWPCPVVAVQFTDGEVVRMSFASEAGRPWNIGHAMRVAISAYRSRVRNIMGDGIYSGRLSLRQRESFIAVPEVWSCRIEQEGIVRQALEPGLVNERTAEARAGMFELPLIEPTLPHVQEAVQMHYRTLAARVALRQLADVLDPSEARHMRNSIFEAEAVVMRHNRLMQAVEVLAALPAVEPVAPPQVPAAPDCLVWHAEKRRRTATGGARWVLKLAGTEIGCAFKSAKGGYRAAAAIGLAFINVDGETMVDVRNDLETQLHARSVELFALSSVQFSEAAQ